MEAPLVNNTNRIIFTILSVVVAIFLGFFASSPGSTYVIIGVFAVLVLILSFVSVIVSLQVLIVSMLFSPEISIMSLPVRDVTIRLDDITLTIMTLSWLLRMALLKDIGFIVKSSLNRSIVIFSSIAIISTTLGIARNDVSMLAGIFFVLKMIEYFFLFFMVINYVLEEKTINSLISTMLIVFAFVSLYGLFQVITGGDISAPFEGAKPERNTLGGYLALLGGLAGGIILNTDSKAERRLLAITMVVMVIVLLYSSSRSGWLSVVAVFFSLFYYSKNKNIYSVLIMLLLFTIPLWVPDAVKGRINYTFVGGAGRATQVSIMGVGLDPSSSARLNSWGRIVNNIFKHPFLGYGVKGYGFVDGQYFLTLIETGFIGFFVFIWLLFKVNSEIRSLLKKYSSLSPRLQGMAVGVMAGFWGIVVHAITANSFIIIRIAEPFWYLVGMAVVLNRILEEKKKEQNYDVIKSE